jgi:hypothetical protein
VISGTGASDGHVWGSAGCQAFLLDSLPKSFWVVYTVMSLERFESSSASCRQLQASSPAPSHQKLAGLPITAVWGADAAWGAASVME